MEAYNSLWSVFANLAIIAVLLLAYLIVVLAFFIIAIQIFITLIEFKLVTLAGFVLLPFAFWNRTAFMAEKVLGHIVSSGIKVLVLAVITGIGTTLFSTFTATVGPEPDARQVLAIALGALSLLGLSIFGPGIANGIVSGGPQLGAGAAAGTVLAAGGALVGGAAAAKLGVGAAASTIGATGRMGAAAAQGGARMAGGAAGAYSVGSLGRSGAGAVAGGMAAVGQTAATGAVNAALSPLRRMAGKASASMKDNFRTGARAGLGVAPASGSPAPAASPAAPASAPPAWASAMKQRQSATHGATVLAHTMKAGDSHGGGGGPDVKERSDPKMFRRPTIRYGQTPEPATPYQRAAQVWDDRIGSARVQAKNWRLAFFGALALSGGLSAGLVWQSARGHIVPWVVQVDRLGEAQAVAPAETGYRPTDPQIAFHLARFIEQVRAIPADPVIVRQNWLRAYDFTTDKGALALNDYARADPIAQVGKVQVAVDVSSVIRASGDSFRVAWIERRYQDGSLAETTRWSAILTVVVQTPRTPDALRKNPLGVFVNALNWSKELSQ
jgi:type IV secretion system protein TrbL